MRLINLFLSLNFFDVVAYLSVTIAVVAIKKFPAIAAHTPMPCLLLYPSNHIWRRENFNDLIRKTGHTPSNINIIFIQAFLIGQMVVGRESGTIRNTHL